MALDANALASALGPVLKQAHIDVGASDNAALSTFCDALASAIATKVVDHIVANAEVATVTACGAGAGTGTGGIT